MGNPPVLRRNFASILCALVAGIAGAFVLGQVTVQASPRAAAASVAALPAVAATSSVFTVTQTFTLHGGWNAIYLEVEPLNTSPLVNEGTESEPFWTPERSTMETVFASLPDTECLESVWTWNTPQSTQDYIVDPSEGLWDEPGWKHYFPDHSVNEDGVSLAFLTDLLSLHAHTAYLVKLADGCGDVALAVPGTPTVSRKHWTPGSYNLSGFAVQPGENPAAASFLAGSPITETLSLSAAGVWEPAANLRPGQAYMFYYSGATADAGSDYAGPLKIEEFLPDGLQFLAGANRDTLTLVNDGDSATQVTLTLPDGAAAAVALRVSEPVTAELRAGPATFNLAAGDAVQVNLTVLSVEQPQAGAALLEIRSDQGVRWQIPVTAASGSHAGLWVGDVTVNDVSESRLGGTNVADGALTIALRSQNAAGIGGAAELSEAVAGSSDTVVMTLTLALPAAAATTALQPISGTAPYVGGYVFVDANQNGQRDADEAGLAGVDVTLDGVGTIKTAADGSYLFENVAGGSHAVAFAAPAGYTSDFPIVLPEIVTATTNSVPAQVTLDATGITAVSPAGYLAQVLPAPATLPYEDATGARVEPLLNLGLVPVHDVTLWTVGPGSCSDPLVQRKDLGQAKNGSLVTTLASAALNPGPQVDDLLLGGAAAYAVFVKQAGQTVACGEVAVGAPTSFANGLGSEYKFRVILRVDEQGDVQLLPHYVVTDGLQISAANFNMVDPLPASGHFTGSTGLLDFYLILDAEDPLNPFKHKYHPDHDNLDTKFNAIDMDKVPPEFWESYEVRRRIALQLTDLPPLLDRSEAAVLAQEVDWGGATWGGLYQEVLQGLHKNDITVKGYFVIRQVLAGDELTPQSYDR